MRGMGHCDAIESVTFRHEEGNEGGKIGVKRGNRGFYGGKLLKRKGEDLWGLPQERGVTDRSGPGLETRETWGNPPAHTETRTPCNYRFSGAASDSLLTETGWY
jgi:hypothetical protein